MEQCPRLVWDVEGMHELAPETVPSRSCDEWRLFEEVGEERGGTNAGGGGMRRRCVSGSGASYSV